MNTTETTPNANTVADVNNNNAATPINKNFDALNDKFIKNTPAHIVNMIYLIRNNRDIRRFVSLGIINYLLQKGEISGEKNYVNFMWFKFSVSSNGIKREFKYTEPFFLNALAASVPSLGSEVQRKINEFTKAEMSKGIDDVIDTEEVEAISSSILNS